MAAWGGDSWSSSLKTLQASLALRAFPTAGPKKTASVKRKRRRSESLTDTPVKQELEEEEEETGKGVRKNVDMKWSKQANGPSTTTNTSDEENVDTVCMEQSADSRQEKSGSSVYVVSWGARSLQDEQSTFPTTVTLTLTHFCTEVLRFYRFSSFRSQVLVNCSLIQRVFVTLICWLHSKLVKKIIFIYSYKEFLDSAYHVSANHLSLFHLSPGSVPTRRPVMERVGTLNITTTL